LLVKLLEQKIIVVLGHSNCGAIKGACDHIEMGNLTRLLSKIRPAIDDESTILENRNSTNESFVEKVALINVNRATNGIVERSPILKEMAEQNKIKIIGGMHDLTSAKVTFTP